MSAFSFITFTLLFLETSSDINTGQTILIDLPDKFPLNDLNFFQIYELESLSEHKIIIRNMGKNLFGLLQIHSFMFPVRLQNPNSENFVNGTNIGFTVQRDGEFILSNTNNFIKVETAIGLVMMNQTTAPLPGGCRSDGPGLKLEEVGDIVRVVTPAAASAQNDACPSGEITYESRYKYLRVGDTSSQTYFDGIREMITADRARSNGKENEISMNDENQNVVNLYAKMRGTGIVFQTIALDFGGRSVYIPTVTYSCNILVWNSNCMEPDLLSLGFYVILLVISILLMTRMLLPCIVNHLCIGLGSGMAVGVFITPHMEMNWRAFITIFCSLTCTGLNYVLNKRFAKTSHCLTSFWLCCISSLTLFFVTSFSFNLVDYQYIFLVAFAFLGTILLATRSHQFEIKSSIILAGFLFMFSISFLTNGHLNDIIEQPYNLAKDFTYKNAIKKLLIAPQDMIAFCLALTLTISVIFFYNRYGNIWEKMLEREKLLRAQRVALGGGTLHDRLIVASEQTPLISRYTETEEDDVFESPNTNRELYLRVKGK